MITLILQHLRFSSFFGRFKQCWFIVCRVLFNILWENPTHRATILVDTDKGTLDCGARRHIILLLVIALWSLLVFSISVLFIFFSVLFVFVSVLFVYVSIFFVFGISIFFVILGLLFLLYKILLIVLLLNLRGHINGLAKCLDFFFSLFIFDIYRIFKLLAQVLQCLISLLFRILGFHNFFISLNFLLYLFNLIHNFLSIILMTNFLLLAD